MKNAFVKLSLNLEYWFRRKCLLKMFVYVCISSYGDANPFMQSRKDLCKISLSLDVAPGSDITPCNKIDKPLVVYRFSNVT